MKLDPNKTNGTSPPTNALPYEIHGKTLCVQLDNLVGHPCILFVDTRWSPCGDLLHVDGDKVYVRSFLYNDPGRQKRPIICGYLDQPLANLVAVKYRSFYSVTLKRPSYVIDGIRYLDYRLQNLTIKQTDEQKEAERWSREAEQRELVGSIGKDGAELSEDEVAARLLQTKGSLRQTASESLYPTDSYKPRMMQVNGKIANQALDVDNLTNDRLNAAPIQLGARLEIYRKGERPQFTGLGRRAKATLGSVGGGIVGHQPLTR